MMIIIIWFDVTLSCFAWAISAVVRCICNYVINVLMFMVCVNIGQPCCTVHSAYVRYCPHVTQVSPFLHRIAARPLVAHNCCITGRNGPLFRGHLAQRALPCTSRNRQICYPSHKKHGMHYNVKCAMVSTTLGFLTIRSLQSTGVKLGHQLWLWPLCDLSEFSDHLTPD